MIKVWMMGDENSFLSAHNPPPKKLHMQVAHGITKRQV